MQCAIEQTQDGYPRRVCPEQVLDLRKSQLDTKMNVSLRAGRGGVEPTSAR